VFRGGRREEHLRICAFAHLHHHLDVVDKKKEPERQDDATTPPLEPSPAPCCQQLILPSLSSNGVHAHAREGEGTCCAHAAAASPSPTYTLKSEIEASLGHKGTQRDNLEPVCVPSQVPFCASDRAHQPCRGAPDRKNQQEIARIALKQILGVGGGWWAPRITKLYEVPVLFS